MVSAEVRAVLARLKMLSSKAISGPIAGEFETVRRTMGVEFFQLREYQPGDDIRFIDWKSSLRSTSVMVKESVELKTQTVVLLLDTSGSSWYGSQTKRLDQYKKIAAMLAYVSAAIGNRVGALLFDQSVHAHIPAVATAHAIQQLAEHMMLANALPASGTDLVGALQQARSLYGSDAVYLVLSDCFTDQEALLKACSGRLEVNFIQVLSSVELDFPAVGTLAIRDVETQEVVDVAQAGYVVGQTKGQLVDDFKRRCQAHGFGYLAIGESDEERHVAFSLVNFFLKRLGKMAKA